MAYFKGKDYLTTSFNFYYLTLHSEVQYFLLCITHGFSNF